MSTASQKFARKRNWTKRSLIGLETRLRNIDTDNVLTNQEKIDLREARSNIMKVLYQWDDSYKESKHKNVK